MFLKKFLSFLFPGPKIHYTKVLNCITDNCDLKYSRKVVHAHAASFSKIQTGFLKLPISFILRNNQILIELITFSENKSIVKVILPWALFLIFRESPVIYI